MRPEGPRELRLGPQLAAEGAGQPHSPACRTEEPGSAENRAYLVGPAPLSHLVKDRPVLDPVADLLEPGAREGTGPARVDEHELAGPDRREGIGSPVARCALPVEDAIDFLERGPKHEHARVRKGLGGGHAGRRTLR